MKIHLSCDFCTTHQSTEIELPDGWATDEDKDLNGLCPDHAAVRPFIKDQCPGCVGGWRDCPLWEAFTYGDGRGRPLNDDDFKAIDAGICPRRVNGTFSIGPQGMERIDLSERAPSKAGKALSQAIRDYVKTYYA